MRKRPRALVGLGDADQFEQLDGAGPRRSAGDVAVVYLDGLGDLVADRVDGSQGGHRVLEYRADGLSPHPGHPLSDSPSSSSPCSRTDPVTSAYSGSRPTTAIALADLPAPDSPTSATTSPASTSIVHPAHGGDLLGFGREADGEVAHLQETHLRLLRSGRALGSSASRSPSPTRLVHSTISTSTPAGNRKPTGISLPTSCLRRSACRATHPVAGCRIRGSSARFRR